MSKPCLSRPLLSLIVAVTENGVIGRDNAMPWHLPSDLQRFKTTTWGKPIIMGRKTHSSIGGPLKGRTNIVITRSDHFTTAAEEVLIAHSLSQAQDLAARQAILDGEKEIFIIGGAEIFKLALPQADRLYITEILATIDGDTYFPSFRADEWQVITSENPVQGEKDSHKTRFVIYEKREDKHCQIAPPCL